MDMAVLTSRSVLHIRDLLSGNDTENAFLQGNNEVISRVKFIGLVKRDEKINTRLILKQPNTIYTKLTRWLVFPDNRANTLKFITSTMCRAFEILEKFLTDGETELARSLIGDIEHAKNGLYNLIETYQADTKLCCDFSVLLQNMDAKLGALKKSRTELFAEIPEEPVPEENKEIS